MPYCGSCGKELPAGAAFCPMCGASTSPPPAAPPPSVVPIAPGPFLIKEAVAYGWKAMRDHLGLFLGCELFLFAVFVLFEGAGALVSPGGSDTPSFASVLLFIPAVFVQYTLTLGLYSLILTLHDGGEGRFAHLFSRAGQFFPYLGMMVLKLLAIAAGLILLVIPGVYLMICFALSDLSLVDRRLGPIEALKRSARLTRGHRWRLFLFGLLLLLINIGGALCLLVGLLFTVPASWMALAFAYRRLEALALPTEGMIPR